MLELYLINFVPKTCRIRGSPVDSWQVRDDRIDCSVGLSKNPAIKILDNGHHLSSTDWLITEILHNL